MPPLTEWQTLISMQASAAATLTGLVFVAASINLDKIVAMPVLPARVVETLVQFLQVFFVCTALTIPRQPESALAAEILVVTLFSWTIQMVGFVRYVKARLGYPRWWLVLRVGQTHLASIPFCIAAICLLTGIPGAFYWLVPGFFFSFFAGLVNSWVLLIEVVRP
jgi:hypothetical protein